jgi:hypothetical protein
VPDINAARANLNSGTGTLADQATVMNGSAQNLVAAAGTGFTLHPEAATALIASCVESLNVLEGMQSDLRNLREAPRLGGTKGAQTVSAFTHNVANDHKGIVEAVRNLQGTIDQMRQAYIKAAANYHELEQQVADSVKKLDQEVQQEKNAPVPGKGRIRPV